MAAESTQGAPQAGPDASPVPQHTHAQLQNQNAAQQKPPVISNKLSLEEALMHRRSLLTAIVLLKEDKR